jgi:hypothetical protein
MQHFNFVRDRMLTPIGNGNLGAVSSGHFGGIGTMPPFGGSK